MKRAVYKNVFSTKLIFLVASALFCCKCAHGPAPFAIDVRQAAEAGESDAPYEVVVYSDFQCPFCRVAALRMHDLVRDYPKKVHFYFKHFPLRQHPQAEKAAKAAEAARMQGKFWQMHDLIFSEAAFLTDESYLAFAEHLNLDIEQFKADVASEKVAARIAADRSEADYLGLDGTPFFVVNGAPYSGSFYDLLREIENYP